MCLHCFVFCVQRLPPPQTLKGSHIQRTVKTLHEFLQLSSLIEMTEIRFQPFLSRHWKHEMTFEVSRSCNFITHYFKKMWIKKKYMFWFHIWGKCLQNKRLLWRYECQRLSLKKCLRGPHLVLRWKKKNMVVWYHITGRNLKSREDMFFVYIFHIIIFETI